MLLYPPGADYCHSNFSFAQLMAFWRNYSRNSGIFTSLDGEKTGRNYVMFTAIYVAFAVETHNSGIWRSTG